MTDEEYQTDRADIIKKLAKSLEENYTCDELRTMYQEGNSWNGAFPFVDAVDFETLVDWFYGDTLKLCEMLAEGQYDTSLLFRFDDYGLSNITQEDLDEEMTYYIDDLAEYIYDNYDCRNGLEQYLKEDDIEMLEDFFKEEEDD